MRLAPDSAPAWRFQGSMAAQRVRPGVGPEAATQGNSDYADAPAAGGLRPARCSIAGVTPYMLHALQC